jgi:hypothetical protein
MLAVESGYGVLLPYPQRRHGPHAAGALTGAGICCCTVCQPFAHVCVLRGPHELLATGPTLSSSPSNALNRFGTRCCDTIAACCRLQAARQVSRYRYLLHQRCHPPKKQQGQREPARLPLVEVGSAPSSEVMKPSGSAVLSSSPRVRAQRAGL